MISNRHVRGILSRIEAIAMKMTVSKFSNLRPKHCLQQTAVEHAQFVLIHTQNVKWMIVEVNIPAVSKAKKLWTIF